MKSRIFLSFYIFINNVGGVRACSLHVLLFHVALINQYEKTSSSLMDISEHTSNFIKNPGLFTLCLGLSPHKSFWVVLRKF